MPNILPRPKPEDVCWWIYSLPLARGISTSKLPMTEVGGSLFGIYLVLSLVPRPSIPCPFIKFRRGMVEGAWCEGGSGDETRFYYGSYNIYYTVWTDYANGSVPVLHF